MWATAEKCLTCGQGEPTWRGVCLGCERDTKAAVKAGTTTYEKRIAAGKLLPANEFNRSPFTRAQREARIEEIRRRHQTMNAGNGTATQPLGRYEKTALMRETLSSLGRDAEFEAFADAMRQHGQDVNHGNYYATRSKLWGAASGNGKMQRKPRAAKPTKPTVGRAPSPAASGGIQSFTDLIEFKNLCTRLGGFDVARQAIDLLQELSTK